MRAVLRSHSYDIPFDQLESLIRPENAGFGGLMELAHGPLSSAGMLLKGHTPLFSRLRSESYEVVISAIHHVEGRDASNHRPYLILSQSERGGLPT